MKLAALTFCGPQLGDVRVVAGKVRSWDGDNEIDRPGLMVQKYTETELGREYWGDVCPLSDASFSLSGCPIDLRNTSKYLRELMESGELLNIEIERAAYEKFCGKNTPQPA